MKLIKNYAKKTVLFLLERLVHWRLKKIHPQIIGVTGSVGKTSTKEAIYTVVSQVKSAHRNLKSYNTEFGAFLTILEQESGYSNAFNWLKILVQSFIETWNLEKPPYELLVLEMGADKPGDIEYLLNHIHPTIGVMTNVKPVHLGVGQFRSLENIWEEKSKLVKALPENGWAILNADDPNIIRLENQLPCNIVLFGTSSKADVRAHNIESTREGLKFILNYENKSYPLHFPNLLGRHQVYVVMPAIITGFLMGMSLKKSIEALQSFHLPPGRMNPIRGKEQSLIIDGSYNASPESMAAALEVLGEIKGGRKIAVLGSMNELGEYSEQEHRKIGKMAAQIARILITVGKQAEFYADSARKTGMPISQIHSFKTSQEAGLFLSKFIRKNDIALVKGSQNNIQMEHVVKAIMENPAQAAKLLVRQEENWLRQAL